MTDETQGTTEEELTPEQIEEQEAADFEAALAGEEPPAREESSDEDDFEAASSTSPADEGDEPPAPAAAAPTQEDLEERLWQRLNASVQERYDPQFRNLSGHIGGLKSTLQQMQAATQAAASSGADTPTAGQIKSAMKSGAKLEALKEDFPEWAEAIEEAVSLNMGGTAAALPTDDIRRMQTELSYTRQALNSQQDAIAIAAHRARQYARLDIAYPTWEKDINTPQFQQWVAGQPVEILRKINESEDASDALEVLEKYYEASQPAPPAQNEGRQAPNRRLANAVTPTTGRSATRPSRKSEEEEFIEAFNSN